MLYCERASFSFLLGLETLLSVSLFFPFGSGVQYDPETAAARGFGSMSMRLAATALRRMAPARPPVLVPAGAVAAEAEAEAVICGRGDKKTKRGKRFKGSFGNARPKREKKIERIKDRVEVPRSTPWPLPFKLI
jgi:30S ribosomal protein S31